MRQAERTQILDEAEGRPLDAGATVRRLGTAEDRAFADDVQQGVVCERCWSVLSSGASHTCPTCGATRPESGWASMPYRLRDRYDLVRLLGRGSMGAVFLAVDSTGPRDAAGRRPVFAVKLVQHTGTEADADRFREMFRHETAATGLLGSSPYFVRVSGYETGAQPFLVMEFVPWLTLAQRIDAGLFTPDQVAQLGVSLLQAVEVMHFFRVVHRDLKPSNIFVKEVPSGFRVKIADLGVWSRDAEAAQPEALRERSDVVWGTIPYMSPEQMAGEPVGHRSDLHTVASILWEVSTGRVPFCPHEGTIQQQIVSRREVLRAELLRPRSMPPALYAVLRRALSLSPDDRPSSAGEMMTALRAVLTSVASAPLSVVDAESEPTASGGLRETAPLDRPAYMTKTMAAEIGDRYDLKKMAGVGGMAEVYEAVDRRLHRRVALKLMHQGRLPGLDEERQRQLFIAEARASARLEHPHVVRVFDFAVGRDGVPFLAMEFVTGESLADRLKSKGALSESEALAYTEPLANALVEAHALGLVHRNLKPGRVTLQRVRGRGVFPKVYGFGPTRDEFEALVPSGTVFGTPTYMAPEQTGSDPVGPASDLYALATILFEALTGRVPFDGPTVVSIMTAKLVDSAPRLPERGPAGPISEALRAIVDALLLRDLDRRPADTAAVARWLRALRFSRTDEIPTAELRGRVA